MDLDALDKAAELHRPKIIIVGTYQVLLVDVMIARVTLLCIAGTSLFLFPVPLADIRRIADKVWAERIASRWYMLLTGLLMHSQVGAKVMYDGAHVTGLIAGGLFQASPLSHVLSFNSYSDLLGN